MPGFTPRLHTEMARILTTPSPSQPQPPKNRKPGRPPPYDRYAPLRQLLPYFAILNNPEPPTEGKDTGSTPKKSSVAGKTPAFTPACMAWVGGSLAGYVNSPRLTRRSRPHSCSILVLERSLKTGGVEIPREKWEEADVREEFETEDGAVTTVPASPTSQVYNKVLPDWTRGPLPIGAPAANARVQAQA